MKLVFSNGQPGFVLDEDEAAWATEAVSIFMEAGNDFQKSMSANLSVRLDNNHPWTVNQTYTFQGWLVAIGADFALRIPQLMTETEALAERFKVMRANAEAKKTNNDAVLTFAL